jgi:simple sugar transport system ATP-binding protein
MKILSGFIQCDSGEILLADNLVHITSPADAIRQGIGMLHQDPLDFPPMTAIDNFLIGHEDRSIIPDRKAALRDFNRLSEEFGFSIDPDAYVDTLTVGERQQLEILRLLWLGARVLIMDEPTTGISASQKEKLFATLRKLAEQGMTVLFVSHKLEEVEGLCGRIAVFSRGKLVGETFPPYSTDDLVQMMFGKVVSLGERVKTMPGRCLLKLDRLSIEDYRLNIRDVNLELYEGEVIGLAGMEGSGQRQFLRTISGLMRSVGGKITLDGKDLTGKHYRNFLNAGISYVPAARLEEGLIPGLTLAEHFALLDKSQGFFVNREKTEQVTKKRIGDFFIKGTPESRIEELSGGNQQRALLALMHESIKVMLVEHPTRGLDIESSIWIWGKLKERCRQGSAIIFVSSDLEEVLHYSDRILVFFGGKVSRPIEAAATGVDQLGQLIGGKGW